MKKVRVTAAILAVIILIGVVPTTVSAAAPAITVSSVNGAPGSTVTVTVAMANNPGVCAGRLAIGYGRYLTLTEVKDGGTLPGALFGTNKSSNPYYVTWDDTLASSNTTKNGTLVTLKFNISSNAPSGAQPVTVSYLPGDFVNVSLKSVSFDVTNGAVKVNGDSHVHTFTTYVSDNNATCTEDGTKTARCTKGCGATDTIPDPGSALGHLFRNYTYDNNATCTEDGTRTARCTRGCGATDTLPDPGTALGHSFIDYEPDGNATCTEDGTKTARCENGCGLKNTVPDPGSAHGHRFDNYVYRGDATYFSDGTEVAECAYGCGATDVRAAAGTKLTDDVAPYAAIRSGGLIWENTAHETAEPIYRNRSVKVSVIASDDESGVDSVSYSVINYTPVAAPSFPDDGWVEGSSVTLEEHGEYIVAAKVTDKAGNVTYVSTPVIILNFDLPSVHGIENGGVYCLSAGFELDEDDIGSVVLNGEQLSPDDKTYTAVPEKEGKNDFSLTVTDLAGNTITLRFFVWSAHKFDTYVPDNNATCTENGTKTASCIHHCGATDTVTIPGTALGHDFKNYVSDNNATCTQDGTKTAVCSRGCGTTDTVTDPKSALGHIFKNYVSDNNATCTQDGTKTAFCSRGCGATDTVTDPGSAFGHTWGEWKTTKEPTATSTGEAERVCRNNPEHVEKKTLDKLPPPFTDVDPGAYYADPVSWAVSEGITSGTSPTTFSPNVGCSRAQVVTFLWRAKGSPEPVTRKNAFSDVKQDDYFFKAVLWAVENGITKGTSDHTFSPNDTCTRAQVVTFLWRAVSSPSPKATTHSFRDVKSGDYFLMPVIWAVENNVTKGTSNTTFSPGDKCTRAQVVTFLKRSTDAAIASAASALDGLVIGSDQATIALAGNRDVVSATSEMTLKDTMVAGIRALSGRIDISSYHLFPEDVKPVFQEIINTIPDLFYLDFNYQYYLNPKTGEVTTFVPTYLVSDKNQVDRMMAEYTANIDAICDLIDPAWSDVHKALFVHDYLASTFEYDTTYVIHDIYDFFKESRGVCQAYTLLYIAVLERFGIEVSAVFSESMNHTWNIIKINGKWYHVDVTWDDPIPDQFGKALHTYFLVSDEFISAEENKRTPHYGWISFNGSVVCSDKSFESSVWTGVSAPFVPLNGSWYFIGTDSGGNAIRKMTDFKNATTVKSLNDKWWSGPNAFWLNYFSGFLNSRNTLVYNTPREIFSYDPVTGITNCLFRLPDSENDMFGIARRNGAIMYAVQSSPNELRDYIAAIGDAKRYDADADTFITMKDLAYLRRYLRGDALIVNRTGADADGGGTINASDVTALKAYLAGN